jgi:hypothetical protein
MPESFALAHEWISLRQELCEVLHELYDRRENVGSALTPRLAGRKRELVKKVLDLHLSYGL